MTTNIPEKLAELAALGSENAIADYARGLGIKAVPYDPCCCIVARIIDPPRELAVRVTPVNRTVLWTDNSGEQTAKLPGVVAEFARNFDDGEYPYLEESDDRDTF